MMVPIRQRYARELLPLVEEQRSFLPQGEATLRLERAYFLAAGRERLLARGTPVVFYASGERRQAVAIARATFAGTVTKVEAVLKLGRQGVLSEGEIGQKANRRGQVGVFTFDNVVAFPERIAYRSLIEMGCIDGANLVTVQRLRHDKLRLIVERAFALATP